jgi:hypothetical protein
MRQVRSGFFLVAGALAIAGCASHPPASSTGTAATGGNAPPVAGAATPDAAKTAVPHGYKLVVKHNTDYFCRTVPVTGSHTLKNEICLTRAELDAEKTHSEQIELNHAAANAR